MLVIIKAIVELRDDPWAVVNIAMMIGMIYYLKKNMGYDVQYITLWQTLTDFTSCCCKWP